MGLKMNANKAKRRLLKWHRYLNRTHSMPTGKLKAGYHAGHLKANWDYMTAGRAAPHGLRIPLATWQGRGCDRGRGA
jgi:hypothetical protein